MPQLHAPSEASASSKLLKGKTILVLNSGFPRKRFIFQKMRALDLKIVLVNKEVNWATRYADEFIESDTYDHAASLAKIEHRVKAGGVDGVITFWEDDVPLLATVCERFGFLGNTPEAALNSRNKLCTRRAMEAAGLEKYCAPHGQVKSHDDLKALSHRIGFPMVLKPAWGASSQFVVRVENLHEARNALDYIQANMTPKFDPIYSYGIEILAEAYVPGAEVDVDLLVQDGEVRFHAFTDNFPTKEPFFLETGDAMPSRHESSDLAPALEMAVQAVKALGLKAGAFHVEAKIGSRIPRLVEVNARMGGDYIYEWVREVWGVDLIEESLKIALGLPSEPRPFPEPRVHMVGKYLVPEDSGVISGLKTPPPSRKCEITLHKEIGDAILVPPEGFDSVGWIVGRGNTYAAAEEHLLEATQETKVLIARFDSTSSIGKTRRRNRFSSASIARKRILQSARLERIRGVDLKSLSLLHVGVLCNKFEESASGEAGNGESEALVQQDLTSVGLNIQKALESRGHHVTFFDMNEPPLTFDRISEANVDIMFNVCERVNNSSLLEPHAAAILDCLGVPYTGSNPLSLALCIDKIKVKKILEHHHLPTPKFDYVFDLDDEVRPDLRYPLIVKPANTDNSIGISNNSVVTNAKDLRKRLDELLAQYKRPALIEEFVDGDEVDVSVLGNEERVRVLPLSRSIFDEMPEGLWHIYPFKAKWTNDPAYEKIKVERPARYSQKLTALISEICLDAYNIFDCHDYARIEVRVDKQGNPYILEINPNPSINRGDCVPNCAAMVGLPYEDFIEEILKEAILRYQARPPYYHLQSSIAGL